MLVSLFVYKFIFLKNEFHIVCFIFKRRVKRVLWEWTSFNVIRGSKCLTEPWNDKSSSRGGIRDFYNRIWYPKRVKWLTTNPSFIVRSLDFPSYPRVAEYYHSRRSLGKHRSKVFKLGFPDTSHRTFRWRKTKTSVLGIKKKVIEWNISELIPLRRIKIKIMG